MKNVREIWPLELLNEQTLKARIRLKTLKRLIDWLISRKFFTPEEGDGFGHNEIWINATAKVIRDQVSRHNC